ncbi:hypothetical protein A0H81_14008 [Grifola frondosa]|uniref:Uncharacterized protein n=1 Tax=Grifola frondosa TaxID=5627 RepID=A0A1C7LMN4_GRIFR|nr:hypothetical protein A0H81_14008 [Grifola frondosa]
MMVHPRPRLAAPLSRGTALMLRPSLKAAPQLSAFVASERNKDVLYSTCHRYHTFTTGQQTILQTHPPRRNLETPLIAHPNPHPPSTPTARYSRANLTSREAEQLLTRSASLDKLWDADTLACMHKWDVFIGSDIVAMSILPGGEHLVASLADRALFRFAVVVVALGYRRGGGACLAKMSIPTKAHLIEAKYMTVRGQRSIVIATVRRDYRNYADYPKFDVNRLGARDDSQRVVFKCAVDTMALSSIENHVALLRSGASDQAICDALDVLKPPFQKVLHITTRRKLTNPTLDEDASGSPYLAIIRQPDGIMVQNLNHGQPTTTLFCRNTSPWPDLPHSLTGLRILPHQNQVMVVHQVDTIWVFESPRPFRYYLETYDVPQVRASAPQNITVEPAAQAELSVDDMERWEDVWITDHGHPRPISIIAQTSKREGLLYSTLFPERVEDDSGSGSGVRYRYGHPPEVEMKVGALYAPPEQKVQYRVLPGSLRPLVCTIPANDRNDTVPILEISRLWDPALLGQADPQGEGARSRPMEFGEGELGVRVWAAAWDETIGRLCIVREYSHRLLVYDFASAPAERDDSGREGRDTSETLKVDYELPLEAGDAEEKDEHGSGTEMSQDSTDAQGTEPPKDRPATADIA